VKVQVTAAAKATSIDAIQSKVKEVAISDLDREDTSLALEKPTIQSNAHDRFMAAAEKLAEISMRADSATKYSCWVVGRSLNPNPPERSLVQNQSVPSHG
jgi:hypothetical protein